MFKAANPFEDQTPAKILSRQYKIADVPISPAFTFYQISFPQVFFNMPSIRAALSTFYYFRADLEVSIKVNSTPYHQGMCMVSFYHDCISDSRWNLIQRSALSPVLLDYSTSDSATITYGWLHPQVFMPLKDYTSASVESYIGTLTITPLATIANTSGGNTTITVTLYARLLNVRTAGFRSTPPEAQSGKTFKFNYLPETEEKSYENMPISNAVDKAITPLFKAVPLIADTASGILDAFASLTKLLDKPQDISTPMKMQYALGDDMMHGIGTVLSNRLSLYPTSRLAHFPISPMCHSTEMSMTELAMIPMLYTTATFNETFLTKTIYCHPLTADLGYSATGDGIVTPDYLALVTSLHRYWRGGIKYLFYFVTNAFTTARFRISYVVDYDEDDLAYGGDFPSIVLDIKGSTMTKVTVPYLYQTPYRMTFPTGTVNPLEGTNLTPKLKIDCLTVPVCSLGEEPYISLIVFRAAAEDFQVASLTSSLIYPNYMNVNKEVPQAQTSLQDEFKFTFPAITCKCDMATEQGFCTTETVGKISDVMKRFDNAPLDNQQNKLTLPSNSVVPAGIQIGPGVTVESQKYTHPFYTLLQLFKYQRGSMRYKYFMEPTETNPSLVYFTPSTGAAIGGSGESIWVRSHNPVYTVESPWIATIPYYPTDAQSIVQVETMEVNGFSNTTIDEEFNTSYLAFGDDRVHSYLLPPAYYLWVPEATLIKAESVKTEKVLSPSKEKEEDKLVRKKDVPKPTGKKSL
jgi:hypothetical protein